MAKYIFPEHSYIVPPTLNKTHECQVIRKISSNRENTDKAIEAFKDWEILPQDVGVVVRFDDEKIKDFDHQECHDTVRHWLAGWAHFRTSQTRPTAMSLLRNVTESITIPKYQQ